MAYSKVSIPTEACHFTRVIYEVAEVMGIAPTLEDAPAFPGLAM